MTERRLLLGEPAENYHQLFVGRAILGGDPRTGFSQAVGGALRQLRGVAPLAEAVA